MDRESHIHTIEDNMNCSSIFVLQVTGPLLDIEPKVLWKRMALPAGLIATFIGVLVVSIDAALGNHFL